MLDDFLLSRASFNQISGKLETARGRVGILEGTGVGDDSGENQSRDVGVDLIFFFLRIHGKDKTQKHKKRRRGRLLHEKSM